MAGSSKYLELGGTTSAPAPSTPISTPHLASTVVENGTLAKEAIPAIADAANSSLPQNWSGKRKWLILIVLSLMSLMVYVASDGVSMLARFLY